jgi:hypothetical protein
MLLLPNHSASQLEIAKLRDYCLNSDHPRGRHKARQFASSLGIYASDAEWLRENILQSISAAEAFRQTTDDFGQRWRVDMLLARQNRRAMIRTIWMIRHNETFPRFITCWVL